MNRSLSNVILGGYKATTTTTTTGPAAEQLPHTEVDVAGAVDALVNANEVVIVPGYGLAVAGAQYAIADLAKTLKSKGVNVRFAIHPVWCC